MIFVDNQQVLTELCEQIATQTSISVDTEFQRRTTFFARLSIIQIVTSRHKIIIDALAGLDLTPIKNIFADERIVKIFHSPREDFEILYRLFKQLPQNIFDTQTAASVCGFGNHLSYSDLCMEMCRVTIDKTLQRAEWMRRPIPVKMLEYAIKDAEYLQSMYLSLKKTIEDRKLGEAYKERLKPLVDPKTYMVNLETAWQKVRFSQTSGKVIERMKVFAAFREECASALDIPRRYFASDEDLLKLCHHLPSTERELIALRLDSHNLTKHRYRNKLFEICNGLAEL